MAEPRQASPAINRVRLQKLRIKAGLTLTDLARKIGKSPAYLSQIERGHRRTVHPATFNAIVVALDVEDPFDLLLNFEQDAA
jgi:transcriptional regulator with XRE-family HTH domain